MKLPLIKPPKHICILRLSALGDVCNLVPAVRAIQRHWPETKITWITGKAEYSLLVGLSGVEFIVYDKKTGLRGMRDIWRQLGSTKFDVLLHAQQALRGSVLSMGLKAKIKLGYDRHRAKDWQWLFTNAKLQPRQNDHVLESFMDFARALGVEIPNELNSEFLTWDIPIPESAFQEAEEKTHSALGGYYVLSPCSTQRARNFRSWTPEGYARVVDRIHKEYGLTCILTGGNTEQEHDYAQRIQSQVSSPVIDLVGKTTIKGLLAVIKGSAFTIAPDSGPVHIANALGVPVLGIFATTNPNRAAPYLWKDYVVSRYDDALERFMCKKVDDVKWGQRVRYEDAMELVTVDDVMVGVARIQQVISDSKTM